jgi:hypothetical protein
VAAGFLAAGFAAASSSLRARASASSATSAFSSRNTIRCTSLASLVSASCASHRSRNSSKEVGMRSAGSCEVVALIEQNKNILQEISQ